MKQKQLDSIILIPALFFVGRLILLVTLPPDGLRNVGDMKHFYDVASLGWPFRDYWVEYPPLFPFLSAFLYQLVAGREHTFYILLAILFSFSQAGSFWLLLRIGRRFLPAERLQRLAWVNFSLLIGLAYGWQYIDPLSVFVFLLGVTWILEGRDGFSILAISTGILLKLFPGLALVMVWQSRPWRRALGITALTLGICAALYAGLYAVYPKMTAASLQAQMGRGSWQTVWALIDGNRGTGNFGTRYNPLDPASVNLQDRKPSRIPPVLALIPFAILGGWLFLKANIIEDRQRIAFLGLTLAIFLLWSSGWSPQWVLYLLPLVLLALPEREAILMAFVLTLVNVLEWPVLLSRGYFWGLWLTIPVRTVLLVLLAIEFWQAVQQRSRPESPVPALSGETN